MPSRLDDTFARLKAENSKAFVAYVAAGDPDPDRSLEILVALADAGADIIELGLPFSDPMADGVVNQLAAARALKAGANTRVVLDLIRRFRETRQTAVVLFTYLNPVYAYGYEEFHRDAATAGADGILLLDLPPDEAARNAELARGSGLQHIRLVAPTTPPDRLPVLAKDSEGFIYVVSRTGVTGAHGGPSEAVGAQIAAIRKHTMTPVCVGFGISTPEQAAMVAGLSDGVVVGSAIVKQIELHQHAPGLAARVSAFARPLINATKRQ